jgi:hypothetical protein
MAEERENDEVHERDPGPAPPDIEERDGKLGGGQRQKQARVGSQTPVHHPGGQQDEGIEQAQGQGRGHERGHHEAERFGCRDEARGGRDRQRHQQGAEYRQHLARYAQLRPAASKLIGAADQQHGIKEHGAPDREGLPETRRVGDQKDGPGDEAEAPDEPSDVLHQERRDERVPARDRVEGPFEQPRHGGAKGVALHDLAVRGRITAGRVPHVRGRGVDSNARLPTSCRREGERIVAHRPRCRRGDAIARPHTHVRREGE